MTPLDIFALKQNVGLIGCNIIFILPLAFSTGMENAIELWLQNTVAKSGNMMKYDAHSAYPLALSFAGMRYRLQVRVLYPVSRWRLCIAKEEKKTKKASHRGNNE